MQKKYESLSAKTREEAWQMAGEIFGCDYEEDAGASNGAGYPIYRGVTDAQCWISDLNCRLELNMADGDTINIWIDEPVQKYTAEEVKAIITEAQRELAAIEKITQLVGNLFKSDTATEVLHEMAAKRNQYKAKLALFGL